MTRRWGTMVLCVWLIVAMGLCLLPADRPPAAALGDAGAFPPDLPLFASASPLPAAVQSAGSGAETPSCSRVNTQGFLLLFFVLSLFAPTCRPCAQGARPHAACIRTRLIPLGILAPPRAFSEVFLLQKARAGGITPV